MISKSLVRLQIPNSIIVVIVLRLIKSDDFRGILK